MSQSDTKVKAEKFSTYAYHAQTIKDINRSNKIINNQIYELTFHGIAKIMRVREKYELIMGSPWIQIPECGCNHGQLQKQIKKVDLHPFFLFLIKKLLKYDAISLIKITVYSPTVLHEIYKKEDDERGYPTIKISQLFDIEYMHEIQNKLKDKQGRLQRLKWLHQQMQNDEFICKMQYKELLKKGYRQDIVEKMIKNEKWPPQMLEIIGQKFFQQVKAIQPLRESYQAMKLKLFEMNHKKYYLTSFPVEKPNQNHCLNSICIKKPALEPFLLHSLQEHVRNRNKIQANQLKAICRQMIKNLVKELKQYTNKVSNEFFKGFYEFLQPKNVLIDQVSLKPKLSFNPVLLDALGLRTRPMTIENMLSFFPTPQTFDYFYITPFMESQNITNLENQLIIKDPFYGCIDLFTEEKYKLQVGQVKEILEVQADRLWQTKQKILVWKILLNSYYITNGNQFGFITSGNTAQKLQYFKQQINQASQLLKKNIKQLEMFFTPTKLKKEKFKNQAEQQSKQFDFTFESLQNYLGLNQESDEIVQDLRYKKIKRYHQLRKLLLRQITKILRKNSLFIRLYNVKKYMIIYCVIALQLVEQTYEILSAQQKRSGERKQLMQNFDKYIRKLKNQKTYIETLNFSFTKIEKYRKENRGQADKQAAYIKQDQQGLKMFQYLTDINSFVNNLAELNKELNKMEQSIKEKDEIKNEADDASNNQMKKKYKIQLEYAFQHLNTNIQTIRNLCYEVAITCFKSRQPEQLHKYDKDNKTSKESFRIFSIEFEITLMVFFSLEPKNILKYENLVIPYLNLDEQQKKPQVRIIESENQRQSKLKLLEFIKDLLGPDISRRTAQQKEKNIVLYKNFQQSVSTHRNPQAKAQKNDK